MRNKLFFAGLLIALVAGAFSSCSDGGGINIFSIEDDKKFGQQFRDSILANPTQYPVLPEAQYPQAYQHLRRIRDRVLASTELNHRNDFTWDVYIINDDNTLNAFCIPGGYIFAYTGIIKYLDTEDQFAGVMGHEIAHADLRHSTDQMTQAFGLETILAFALGNASQNQVAQISSQLLQLSFSRNHEKQADEYSVRYLCGSGYAANGAAGFFTKLTQSGQGGNTPAFLSTHPNPDNRITNINSKATDLGCSTTEDASAVSTWAAFKASLPH